MNTAGHWTVVREVIHSTADGAMILSAMPGIVRRLLDEEAWRKFEAPGAGTVEHDSFTEFMEDKPPRGLDGKRSQLLALCGSDGELTNRVKRLLSEEIEPLGPEIHAGPGRGKKTNSGTTGLERGADYVVARLKRDDPTLAKQVVRGEITANAAARAAGIRRPRIVLSTPERIARSLKRHLDEEALWRLIELLKDDL
jgi:hypothetical protein